jgi:putative superfamily III holin-X
MERDGELRDKHLGELIAQLGADTSTLVRQEMELARAELTNAIELVRADVREAVDVARAETTQKLGQARTDVAEKGKQAGMGIGLVAAAAVACVLGLGGLTACLVLLLNRWLAADASALIVALAWTVVAAAAALRGRDKVRAAGGLDLGAYLPRRTIGTVKDDLRKVADVKQLVPEQTIETVKEDVEWAKHPRRSAER